MLIHGRPPHTGRCGYVAQDPANALVMSRAGDDVAFGLENLGTDPGRIWPEVGHALAAVGLAGFEERDTTRLSGGEQQRLVLAGVLATRPDVLLLDEPTALLDPDGAADVRETVRALTTGGTLTVVVVEHRVAEWAGLVDRVVVLDAGAGVVADGPPDAVFRHESDALATMGVWTPAGPGSAARRAPASATGEVVVHGDRLTLRYPDTASDAVAALDVDLRAGRLLAITGANGAGKSTAGRLLAGLVVPTGGGSYAGRRPADAAAKPLHNWRSAALARTVGMVFQNPEHQFVASTVQGELGVGQKVAGVDPRARSARVGELLERLRLTHLADADPFTLSGGEQRRLSVATALASAPAAVVLDEPTFGQDLVTWKELVTLLDEVRRAGTALCCISHDAALVDALADDRLVLVTPGPVDTGPSTPDRRGRRREHPAPGHGGSGVDPRSPQSGGEARLLSGDPARLVPHDRPADTRARPGRRSGGAADARESA